MVVRVTADLAAKPHSLEDEVRRLSDARKSGWSPLVLERGSDTAFLAMAAAREQAKAV